MPWTQAFPKARPPRRLLSGFVLHVSSLPSACGLPPPHPVFIYGMTCAQFPLVFNGLMCQRFRGLGLQGLAFVDNNEIARTVRI